MKSWKTTVGGLLILGGQLSATALPAHLQWISAALTGIGGLILGASARDNKVSTEQARSS